MKTAVQLLDVSDVLQKSALSGVNLTRIAAPNTTVLGRAPMVDITNDLVTRMGNHTILCQKLYEIPSEQGPTGQKVFGVINDVNGQMRFVGTWAEGFLYDNLGQYATTLVVNDYCEITFNGTGLDMLAHALGSPSDVRASVDGGSEGANIVPGAGQVNTVLNNLKTNPNVIIPVVSGLAPGIHTVKLRVNLFAVSIHGFRIQNAGTQLRMHPGTSYIGGERLVKPALNLDSYNSNFESGTLGTRGGRVSVYQKADGSIKKSVTPAGTSALFLVGADHTNEEVIRTHHWREFGAWQLSPYVDFNSLDNTSDARPAFALDDNTTILAGKHLFSNYVGNASEDYLAISNSAAGFVDFTFVGTGLDIVVLPQSNVTSPNNIYDQVWVDGVNVGSITYAQGGPEVTTKIVSGLAYGTHKVRLQTTGATISPGLRFLKVYGPKKPTVPSESILLQEYFILGNFSHNTNLDTKSISAGVIRKSAGRELVYVGSGWVISNPDPELFAGAGDVATTVNGDTMSFSFFGTGFDYRFYSDSSTGNTQLTLDGGTNFTGYTVQTSLGVGSSFAAATGILTNSVAGNDAGQSVAVTGLALGYHTIVLEKLSGTYNYIDTIDVVCPIHAADVPGYTNIQNIATISSEGLADLRNIVNLDTRRLGKVLGQAKGATISPSNTNSSYKPLWDLAVKVKGNDNWVNINAMGTFSGGTAGTVIAIAVNGKKIDDVIQSFSAAENSISAVRKVFLPKGDHLIYVQWTLNSGGTIVALYDRRNLEVEES